MAGFEVIIYGRFWVIAEEERNLAVSLSQLTPDNPDDSTRQAIEDWHYWLAQGYCF